MFCLFVLARAILAAGNVRFYVQIHPLMPGEFVFKAAAQRHLTAENDNIDVAKYDSAYFFTGAERFCAL